MKKLMMVFVSLFLISLMSCNKDEVKQDWVFTMTTVIDISPAEEGYPQTQTTTLIQTQLTETEAKAAAAQMGTTTTQALGTSTLTYKSSATYAVKK